MRHIRRTYSKQPPQSQFENFSRDTVPFSKILFDRADSDLDWPKPGLIFANFLLSRIFQDSWGGFFANDNPIDPYSLPGDFPDKFYIQNSWNFYSKLLIQNNQTNSINILLQLKKTDFQSKRKVGNLVKLFKQFFSVLNCTAKKLLNIVILSSFLTIEAIIMCT